MEKNIKNVKLKDGRVFTLGRNCIKIDKRDQDVYIHFDSYVEVIPNRKILTIISITAGGSNGN